MVDFNQISSNLQRPATRVEFDFNGVLPGLPRPVIRVLLTGQKLAAGTAVAATLYRILSPAHAKVLFGAGSQIALLYKGWYDNADKSIEVWGCGLADAGGATAASGTIVYTGPATASGVLSERICGQKVRVPVTSGMTATQAATAVKDAINALTDLPVTATSSTGTVTVTARNTGPEGNFLTLFHNFDPTDATPAGLTATITAMASGATAGDASAIVTAIGSQPFYAIVQPWIDATNMAVWEACMADRADANKMNYGIAYTHNPSGYSGLSTAAASRNSPYAPISGLPNIPESPFQVAGAVAAINVREALIDPSRPVKTCVLKGITPPRVNQRLTDDEHEMLLAAGIAMLAVNAAGQVCIERMVTTYKTNGLGEADTSLKELTKILTYYAMSWSQQAMIEHKFPRHKLADDGNDYLPGAHVVTPKIVKGELVALARTWHEAGWIENLDQYIVELVVERDANDKTRINSLQRPNATDPWNSTATVIQPVN